MADTVGIKLSTKKQLDKVEKNLEALESFNRDIHIEDGHQFLKDMRKEARRQKAVKVAKDLELQTKGLEAVPALPEENIAEEIALADSFEIYEDD